MKNTTTAAEYREAVRDKKLAAEKISRYKRVIEEYQSANLILEVRRRRV